MVGELVSHYRILEKLGGGGMGVVYKAQDVKLERFVALKFLPPIYSYNEDSKLRIINEAKIASTLEHPNICNIHEVGETKDEQIFIAMAFYEGKTLKEKTNDKSIVDENIEDIISQLAKGLNRAHEEGIIHRDIKPANVFLTDRNEVKILDFGLAKLDGDFSVMDAEKVMGTIAYMSPEQIIGKAIDKRSDIWSFGVLIFELLTGKKPFSCEYEQTALYSIINDDPDLTELSENTDLKYFKEVVQKCLEKNKEDRFQSVQEIIDIIENNKLIRKGNGRTNVFFPKVIDSSIFESGKTIRRKKKMSAIIITLLLATFFIYYQYFSSLHISHPITISLVNMQNETKDPELRSVLSDLLFRELSYSPYIDVLSEDRINEMKNKLKLSEYGLAEALKISRLTNTEVAIGTKFLELGDNVRIDIEAYDVETNKRVMTSSIQDKGKDKVFEMIAEISEEICEKLADAFRYGKIERTAQFETTTDSYAAYKMYTIAQSFRHIDPTKTITLLEQALSTDEKFIRAYRDLAVLVSFHKDDYKSAINYAKKAKELSKKEKPDEYLLSLHVESWVNHDWDNSINYLKKYLEIKNDDIEMKIRLGYILSRYKKEFAEAIQIFEDVLKLDPSNYSGHLSPVCNYMGYANLYSGNFNGAIESFNKALEYSPDKPAAKQNIASAYSFNGQHKIAIRKFKEVLDQHPNYYPTYSELAATYFKIGKWKEAIKLYTQYLNKTPPGITDYAYIKIAEIFLIQNDLTSTNNEISNAFIVDSLSVYCNWIKGLVNINIEKDIDAAKNQLAKMEVLIKNSYDQEKIACYHHLVGVIQLAEGKINNGLNEIRIAESLSPRNFIFFKKELVKNLISTNKINLALKEALTINSYYKNDPQLLILIGDCYSTQEMNKMAHTFYKHASRELIDAEKDFLPLTELKTKLSKISG